MAHRIEPVGDLPTTITLNARCHSDVRQLIRIGLFGTTVEEVVEQLVRDRLRQLVEEGWLKL